MSARFPITGFADEISGDLEVQVATLFKLEIHGLDLRSVGGVNVLDLSDDVLLHVQARCAQNRLSVQSIGSPVNKVPFDQNLRAGEFEKLRKAIHAAKLLSVKNIRIFSPEVEEGQHDAMTGEVIEWMREQRELASDEGVVLIHENDAKYWGAYPINARRLFEELSGPSFRAVFDFANSTLLGYRPLQDWFPWLLPFLDTLHIKDAVLSEHRVVPAGQGDAQIEETLRYLIEHDWRGPLTLEPHLQSAGGFGGYSGERLFEVATNSLREVLTKAGGEG